VYLLCTSPLVVGRSILGTRTDGVPTAEPRKEDVVSSEPKCKNNWLFYNGYNTLPLINIVTHEAL